MTTPARDQARFDLVAYHRALITNRLQAAVAIEKKYELYGLPPELVSIGLEAVSRGLDPFDAIEKPMERSE